VRRLAISEESTLLTHAPNGGGSYVWKGWSKHES
jgi:hypothetical protein